jgi:hypothetical protein
MKGKGSSQHLRLQPNSVACDLGTEGLFWTPAHQRIRNTHQILYIGTHWGLTRHSGFGAHSSLETQTRVTRVASGVEIADVLETYASFRELIQQGS